jgi:hypothetical protein
LRSGSFKAAEIKKDRAISITLIVIFCAAANWIEITQDNTQ